jgi:peptide/nickel transport system substrate-binding protein
LGWGAAGIAGAGLLAACSPGPTATASGSPAPSATPSPVKGGHIVWGVGSDIASMNPLLTTDGNAKSVSALLFDPLVFFDDTLTPVPMLATAAPTVSSDGLTYTFPFRTGAKWSDGQPITVDDVVWTFSLWFDPKYNDLSIGRAGPIAVFDSVTAPDDHTIVMKTKKVYAPFMQTYANTRILPKHVLGSLDGKALNTADFNKKPTVTSGPFKFDHWDPGAQVVLTKNADYYKGAPNVDQFVLRVLSPTSLPSAFPTGEVDLGFVGAGDLARAQTGGNVDTQVVDAGLYDYIMFNLDPARKSSQLFSDKTVRQALLYAIDRKSIADAVFFKTAAIPDSPVPSVSWAYQKPPTQYTTNTAKAEQMLDAAGWKKNAQGIREKNGTPFQFDLLVVSGLTASGVDGIAAQWKSIGVIANTKVMQNADLVNIWFTTRNADAIVETLNWGASDPDQSFLFSTANTAAGGGNFMGYKNPRVDELLGLGSSTVDREKRKSYFTEFADIVMQDLPLIPLWSRGFNWLINKRVQNMKKLGPLTEFLNWYWMKDLYVADGK